MKQKSIILGIIMLCFFAMGFVDLVGIASNYVKADLGLSDTEANLFPSLVFFWFLIFSVPTGVLMNKIGRRRTVVLSLIVTFASLLMPLFGEGYTLMLVSFSLLGIGNAIMQTSLNPLLSNVVTGGNLSSVLTFGQFVKAIASFLAPIIAAWGASQNAFGLGWRVLFPIYMTIAIIATLTLGASRVDEAPANRASGFKACFALLANPFVLLCFVAIMCHVGIDVGTNTTAPKLLQEHLGLTLTEAGFATSLYFIFRTAGCFLGAFILRKVSERTFFALSVAMMAIAMVGFLTFHSQTALYAKIVLFTPSPVISFLTLHSQTVLYVCIALVGFGNSNIFPITFAQALKACPDKQNEVSGLMIMGLFGGTVFPLAMGYASDAVASQWGAVAVMAAAVLYLVYYTTRIKA